MRRCFLLLFSLLLCSIHSYSHTKEPDFAFNTQLVSLHVSSSKSQLILEMSQDIPSHITYIAREVPTTYKIVLQCLNRDIVKFWLFDALNPVFRMNEEDPFPNVFNLKEDMGEEWHNYTLEEPNRELILEYCQTSLEITRKSKYVEIQITNNKNIIKLVGFRVEKKMVFMHMHLPAEFLMGLGERNSRFRIEKGKYTLWAKDNLFAVQRQQSCQHTYSYHPMILYRDVNTFAYQLLYIRSTSAIELDIQNKQAEKLLLINLHGNSFEMLMFNHPSAKQVVELYHEYIGGYRVPPLWYFGFHQSRWGYKDAKKISDVVSGYNSSKLKLESVFLDIDYMKDKKPFTVDTANFPFDELLKLKKRTEIKLIPIVDYAFNYDFQGNLGPEQKEQISRSAVKMDNLFMKTPEGQTYMGKVWPGVSIFPDFYHPNISTFWQVYLSYLSKHIPLDGVWLDMNEIANFENTLVETQEYSNMVLDCGEPLSKMTLPMSVMHNNGWTQMYMHNINGIKQQQTTYAIGRKLFGKDFYFVSRNSFPGSGKYGGHWAGDNIANREFMLFSLSSLMNFNLFGIPFVGSDICGFWGDYSEDLCSQWIQSNTLFPFFRNHNHLQARDQEFYKIGQTIEISTQNAMNLRYSLLKYIYNLFVQRDGKGLIYYPPMFQFDRDFNLSNDQVLENQVMVGRDLMFSISDMVYFPAGVTWYVLNQQSSLQTVRRDQVNRTRYQYASIYEKIPLYVREGAIVIQQDVEQVYRVYQLPRTFNLKCFLDMNKECRFVFHDERVRNQSAVNESSIRYSYDVEGKLFIDPTTQFAETFTLTLTNKDSAQNRVFNLSVQSVSIFYDKPIFLSGGGNCNLTQVTSVKQSYHHCRVIQQMDQVYKIQLYSLNIGSPIILSSGKRLAFQLAQYG